MARTSTDCSTAARATSVTAATCGSPRNGSCGLRAGRQPDDPLPAFEGRGRRSPGELGLVVHPGELVRVAHGEDPRDPTVLDDDADDRGAANLVVDPQA